MSLIKFILLIGCNIYKIFNIIEYIYTLVITIYILLILYVFIPYIKKINVAKISKSYYK
jgi:hypothetical protein